MKKTLLIAFKKKANINLLKELKRKSLFTKIYLLTEKIELKDDELRKFKNIKLQQVSLKREIKQYIDKIFAEHKNYFILPYFQGDSNAKFAIYVYNKTYKTNIDPKVFKQKDKMNSFLGEIANKKNIKLDYNEVQNSSYDSVTKILGPDFIIKPTSGASSLLAFKVQNEEEFYNAKSKITKKYKYILEKYIDGNLYAIDFFFDGKEVYLLCLSREIPFIELLERFSEKYLEKYNDHVSKDFLHFIPIRYTLPFERLKKFELDFVRQIGERLKEINYKGFIHLEYKVKRKEKKIGFIEWGARLGWQRYDFIEKMHNLKIENIAYKLLVEKDDSRYKKLKGINFIKYRNIDRNFIGIKTNVFEKTNIMKIIKKIPDYLNNSFEDYVKSYLTKNWKIKTNDLKFYAKTDANHFLYPFYERSDTRFDYILELDEDSYKKFLSKKHKILEHLVFHDYK